MLAPKVSKLFFFKGKDFFFLMNAKCMIVLHSFWPLGHVSFALYLICVRIRLRRIFFFLNIRLGCYVLGQVKGDA